MKKDKFNKELMDGIKALKILAPTGILEQRFGLDLRDVTETMPSENQETERKPAKK